MEVLVDAKDSQFQGGGVTLEEEGRMGGTAVTCSAFFLPSDATMRDEGTFFALHSSSLNFQSRDFMRGDCCAREERYIILWWRNTTKMSRFICIIRTRRT